MNTNDGLSYNDGGTCRVCVGMYITGIYTVVQTLSNSVHGFLQAEYIVEEGYRLDTMFRLNVKGMTLFGSALVVSGRITAAADGTASKQQCL